MASFHYHPFAPNRKQIRILTLKPAPWDSDIKCELHVASLDEPIWYEALSYVWGAPNPPGTIFLDGVEFSVTPNLGSALRYLRLEDRPRLLWVDAICINQNDLAERKSQVRMMAEIYSKAATTVSWLGEAADESDDVVELIRKLGDWSREHERDIFDGEDPPDDGSIQTITDAVEWIGFPLREQNWPALWRLFERPYWTRVWIIQELAVRGQPGKASGVLHCGTKQFERSQFDYFCMLILLVVMSGNNLRTDTQEIDEPLRSMLVGGHPPGLTMAQTLAACNGEKNRNLDWLLRVTARFDAKDPRDKLYALLGLAIDGDMLEPDYEVSYEHVIANFVSSHIKRYSSLRAILGNRFREIPSGPSWVPDLLHDEFHGGRGLEAALDNDHFKASGSKSAVVSIDDTHTSLTARGVSIGVIDKVAGPLLVAEKKFDQTSQSIVSIYSSLNQDKFFEALQDHYKSLPESSRETFWRTLCLNGDWSDIDTVFPAPTAFATKQRVVFGFESIPADFMPGVPVNARYFAFVGPFMQSLQVALTNRTFISTSDGGMGVGPYMAQTGDIIVVMFGAPFCLVLRPVGHRYKLVGDAYVHGAMSGEFVQGIGQEDGQTFEII
ncbi:heterokaryon incompatibility protein-domain-containing protein [Hypoxylon sp. NC1633]|nr:heterokaryon incompatibility protein-domain-containing protein [Hypoxylon sp. NC1633]